MSNKPDLLAEFPATSYEEWRAVVEKDLKGAPFDKKLLTQTYEGITLQPIYRQEDVKDIDFAKSFPGFAPFVRGNRASGFVTQSWDISQQLPYASPREFNNAAKHDLSRGLTALNLHLDHATRAGKDPDSAKEGEVGKIGVSIATLKALSVAFEDIDLEKTPLFVRSGVSALPFTALFIALVRARGLDEKKLRGCIEMDPLGVISHEGTLPLSFDEAYREMAQLTTWAKTHAPELQTICIHDRPYHESGASAVQELAFSIATGVEYLRELGKRGISVDDAAPRMLFALSIGQNFFMEIAKLRAARLLWHKVVKAFGGSDDAAKMRIHGRTGLWNKTKLDPYVNMLRTTTEAFAGVLGGCESLQVGPFDDIFGSPDEFSRRIARNTQIILGSEAHLRHVIDPAGGSWYLEWLTNQVAEKAWALFQQVETKGGMLAALEANFPQDEIAKVATQRDSNLNKRRDVLVGTNQYPNLKEKAIERANVDYAKIYAERVKRVREFRTSFDGQVQKRVLDKLASLLESKDDKMLEVAIEAAGSGATIGEIARVIRAADTERIKIKPLQLRRLSEKFEALRAASDEWLKKTGKRPQIFLANQGKLSQHKLRADFTRGFVEVAGFEVIYAKGAATPEESAKAAVESGASITVICSTDDTYPDIVPAFTKAVKAAKPDMTVVLAGYPTDHIEAFKAAGVDEFIHIRADVYALLTGLLKKIGVIK